MAWSNEVTYKFIDLYQSEPAIWNPRNKLNKDKIKVNEAWDRISDEMGVPIEVLKKKKETLMAAFRLNHKKKLASLNTKEVFKPIWIFYERLAAFLADVYDCRSITMNNSSAEDGASSSSFTTFQEKWNPVIEIGVEELSNGENSPYAEPSKPVKKRRHSNAQGDSYEATEHMPHICDTFITHALNTISNVLSSRLRSGSDDEDECAIYGKLLATKLRRFSDLERCELMYEIDSLLLQKRIKLEPRQSSPDYN